LAAICLLASASAQAKPERLVLPESFELSAALPKSHGYSVTVSSSNHRRIELKAVKGGLIAQFSVRGRANRNRLDADFGRFGHLSLRFHGRLRHVEAQPTCHGKPVQFHVGTLRGTIRFRGSNGFVDISTNRVHAETAHWFREVCELGGHHGGKNTDSAGIETGPAHPHPHVSRLLRSLDRADLKEEELRGLNVLAARRDFRGGSLELGAASLRGLLAVLSAEAHEKVGRVDVTRSALAIAEPKVLTISEPGPQSQEAILKGRKPFAGRGKYVEVPDDKPSWSGSLQVPLPGEPRVSLTGPQFHVDVCRARFENEVEACLELAS
jgi:hypothetical protein